jgi:hypothetical protein
MPGHPIRDSQAGRAQSGSPSRINQRRKRLRRFQFFRAYKRQHLREACHRSIPEDLWRYTYQEMPYSRISSRVPSDSRGALRRCHSDSPRQGRLSRDMERSILRCSSKGRVMVCCNSAASNTSTIHEFPRAQQQNQLLQRLFAKFAVYVNASNPLNRPSATVRYDSRRELTRPLQHPGVQSIPLM